MLAAMAVLMFSGVRAQTIFFEDFDNDPSVSALPEGWTAYGDTLANGANYSQYNQSWQVWYPDGTAKSGEAMSVTFTTGTNAPCSRWLITPRIELPADTVMSLLFRQRCNVFSQFSVKISTTGTDMADFTTDIGWITMQHEKNYEHISLEEYAGQSVYIAFVNNVIHGNGHCSQFIALDDVEVTHLPENSVKLDDVTLPERAMAGEPITATLRLFNSGRNHIRSVTYSYRINGGEPVERTVNIGGWSWRRHDVNITFTPTELGDATIDFQVSLPNGVEDYDGSDNFISKKMTVTNEPVGIPAMEHGTQMAVYPNPTYGKVTVNSPESIISAAITDMAGRRRELRPDAVDNGNYGFDIAAFPQGAYFLTLATADGQTHTVRLIKR